MNASLVEVREKNESAKYDMTAMAKLVRAQNDYIYEELTLNLGLNLRSLKPTLNVREELSERAKAAYLDLVCKVDTVKRESKTATAAVATGLLGSLMRPKQKCPTCFGPAAMDAETAMTRTRAASEKHSHQVTVTYV